MSETKRERYIRILSGLGGADISSEACKELVELLKEQPETATQTAESAQNVPNDELISRKAAIEVIDAVFPVDPMKSEYAQGIACGAALAKTYVEQLPSAPFAQSEIVYCKDCVKHNKGHGYYLDGTVIGIKDCCPLVEIRGMAQGHEFDYQYCAYAERKTDVKVDKGASC